MLFFMACVDPLFQVGYIISSLVIYNQLKTYILNMHFNDKEFAKLKGIGQLIKNGNDEKQYCVSINYFIHW
jgi:hypothetical protein